MGDRLTPLDATFLELEEADESSHMHIGWAMVFDRLPGGGTPAVARVRQLLDERLEPLPRFRRRLSSPRTGRLSWPSWVPDPGFDLANHVRRARLPRPGGETELLEWLGDFYSHRLDRARPLWEMTLLDGLAGGRWALAAKVHHSLIDGVSGSSVTNVILDAEREPAPGSKAPLAGLVAGNGDGGPGSRLGWLASLPSRLRGMAEVIVRDELIGAPRTSINVRIGGKRRLAAVRVPLEDLKRIKRSLGGTVNDVVLAATAGGLRRLFEARGEGGEEGFRAMVPVSMRGAGEGLALGNRVSSLFVELPVAEPDPLLRYRKTVAAAEGLKRGDHAESAEALVELAGAAPPLIHGAVARLAFTPRAFNVTITNVPGPQTTLYALGAPLLQTFPLVPIFAGHAVGVAVVSYDGEVTFGLNADRARVPDLDVLKRGIAESLAELGETAGDLERGRTALAERLALG
ncbi:MAG TPA: wax ester/triacylglycerol synthase family O-acyltransferase [Solirubrobacterales bacterium]|nr:wax ester/triacylglycerol synthase family O-acyltransferase [Solirubrobacterales bacterium]